MAGGYSKLFGSIITSSLWVEDHVVIRVWIAMLASCNARGEVEGAVPGFASLCRMTSDEMRSALGILLSPDPDSRSKTLDGRRLVEIPGGWRIVNYLEYRERLQEKEGSKAQAMRESRERRKAVTGGNVLRNVTLPASASASASVSVPSLSLDIPSKEKKEKKRRQTKAEKIEGFSVDTKRVVNALMEIWPTQGTSGDATSSTDIALFAQRISEILAKGNDPEILIEAGRVYCTTPRPRFSAPQFFFGTKAFNGGEPPWIGYVRLIITKRENAASERAQQCSTEAR